MNARGSLLSGANLIELSPHHVDEGARIGFLHEDKAAALGRLMAVDGQRDPIKVVANPKNPERPWRLVTGMHRLIGARMPEARLAIRRRMRGGRFEDMVDHPMLGLIQAPNAHYGDIALWFATILSWCLDGNAYWVKVRNRAGRPVELWYIPHWLIEPKAPIDGSDLISHYEYRPGGGAGTVTFAIEDVVHFRHGINPRDLKKGLSPIHGCIREIFMDLESSAFVAALLRNMGVPGVVISPDGGSMPSPEDVAATKAWFTQAFGGDNRGSVLVMGGRTKVDQYGFNPSQMNMSEARDIAEERVCAVLGVPAAVVGFGAGLQQTKVGATMEELRKLAWHNGVLPMGRALVDELKRSLLTDYGETAGLDLYWNTDEVLALQEDEAKQETRWGERLKSGGITLAEYRAGIGLESDASHDIYLRPISVIEVPKGQPGRGVAADPAKADRAGSKAKGDRYTVPEDWLPDDAADASPEAIARGEAYARMLLAQEPGQRDAFAAALDTFFARLGKAAADAWRTAIAEPKGAKAADDDAIIARVMALLDNEAWRVGLAQVYGAQYLEIAQAVQGAAEQAGLGVNLPDIVARAIVASGGTRAGLIDLDEQTRSALFDALAEGRIEGEGVEALARRIETFVESGPWNEGAYRARLIARTETKFAQNISTIERARAAGVRNFVVFDGRFGPPRSELSHIARDGKIVSFEAARIMAENMRPNCTLSFAPHFS